MNFNFGVPLPPLVASEEKLASASRRVEAVFGPQHDHAVCPAPVVVGDTPRPSQREVVLVDDEDEGDDDAKLVVAAHVVPPEPIPLHPIEAALLTLASMAAPGVPAAGALELSLEEALLHWLAKVTK